jgi:hypothetical protein
MNIGCGVLTAVTGFLWDVMLCSPVKVFEKCTACLQDERVRKKSQQEVSHACCLLFHPEDGGSIFFQKRP